MIEPADPPIKKIYYWRWTCEGCGAAGYGETRRSATTGRNRHWTRCPAPRLPGL